MALISIPIMAQISLTIALVIALNKMIAIVMIQNILGLPGESVLSSFSLLSLSFFFFSYFFLSLPFLPILPLIILTLGDTPPVHPESVINK